jgi:Zn-dependent metalloprotease
MPKQLEKKKTTELEDIAIELSGSGSPGGAEEEQIYSNFTSSPSKSLQPKPEPRNTQRVRLSTGLLVEFELVDKYQSKFTQAFKFKYRLRYQGIPLYGSSIIVDLDEDNKFLFANSSEVAQDEAVKKGFPDKNPQVTEKDLKDSISKYCLEKGESISPEALKDCDINPELYYYFKHFSNGSSHKLGEWRLVYVTNIKVMAPTSGEKSVGTSLELTDYVIDAHTGQIILELSNLRTFC